MTRMLPVLGAMILLAGCGDPPAERDAPVSSRSPSPSPTIAAAPVEPSPSLRPIPSPSPSSVAIGMLAAIPEPWRGTWAGEGTACAASSPLRLRIVADRLVFYEAEARPTRIERLSERELQLDLSFAGEGETWTRRNVLALGNDADTLLRSEAGTPTTRYTRCPTAPADPRET